MFQKLDMRISSPNLFSWRCDGVIEKIGDRINIEITLDNIGAIQTDVIKPGHAEFGTIKIHCIIRGKSEYVDVEEITAARAKRGRFDRLMIFAVVAVPAECSCEGLMFNKEGKFVELKCR
jgi:hypothetical protein